MNLSEYKIISKEDIRIKNFKYFHILVPCFCYDITIDFKDGEFNILQSTVQELLKIDSGLRNEPEKLATMLGFDEHKELIEIILEDIGRFSEEFQTKTQVVYIFKERYGGSFLPFVLQEKPKYSEFRQYKNEFKITNNKDIISAKYDFDGLSDDFTLNSQKIYGIIAKHNKNNKRLDVLGFNASNAEDTHFEILLLCKICFDENGKFFITDGYNNNYNSTLADIFRQTKSAFVKELQQGIRVDDSREKTIKLPFEGLENHPLLYENVLDIEKNYNKDIAIFTAFEHAFEVLANKFNGACNETKANLINLAKKHGFKINKKDKISVLGGDKNLPQNLAKILIKEPNLARDLAQKNAKFLQLLSVAKTCRDSQMHAASEVQHLDEKDFGILKDILYFLINEYLHIKFSENNEVKIENSNNNSMDFDEEFNVNLESQQAKERFEFAYKILGNETLKKAQYNEFMVHLSTAFEFILRQKIDDYLQLHRFDFKNKDSLFLYLQNKNIQISSLLDSIKDIHIINAIRLENTTLNALYAVCLSFLDFKEDDRKKIEEIINLRGHGSECRDYDKFCKSSEAKKLFEKFSDFANRLTNHI